MTIAIKMHLKCHMLKSSNALYLLTLLTNAIVEANSVDPDQEQSDWVHTVCFYLHQSYVQQTT